MSRPDPIALARAGLVAGLVAFVLQVATPAGAEPMPLPRTPSVESIPPESLTGLDAQGRPNLLGSTGHTTSAEAPRARPPSADLSMRLLLRAAGTVASGPATGPAIERR
ncbi:hypothetical protein [Salinarimonas sp.]|uniref:hypothetical protein n=1 Tax=Salinarimonas sp. TaxID=2766526 RepID=UPI0032D91B2D